MADIIVEEGFDPMTQRLIMTVAFHTMLSLLFVLLLADIYAAADNRSASVQRGAV